MVSPGRRPAHSRTRQSIDNKHITFVLPGSQLDLSQDKPLAGRRDHRLVSAERGPARLPAARCRDPRSRRPAASRASFIHSVTGWTGMDLSVLHCLAFFPLFKERREACEGHASGSTPLGPLAAVSPALGTCVDGVRAVLSARGGSKNSRSPPPVSAPGGGTAVRVGAAVLFAQNDRWGGSGRQPPPHPGSMRVLASIGDRCPASPIPRGSASVDAFLFLRKSVDSPAVAPGARWPRPAGGRLRTADSPSGSPQSAGPRGCARPGLLKTEAWERVPEGRHPDARAGRLQ